VIATQRSDGDLWKAFERGHLDEWAVLEHYHEWVVGRVLQSVGGRSREIPGMDDCIAEAERACVKCIRRYKPGHDSRACFRTFAGARVSGAVRDLLRARQRAMRVRIMPPRSLAAMAASVTPGIESADWWKWLLAPLSQPERRVVVLHYREGWSDVAELARHLGRCPATIYAIRARALKKLRRRMDDEQ